ncbi:hypothetical protein SCLCIDRAFT_179649 [Scleroderma citrinum Foug A]|uniref:Uncharacterized protein n=1 Tax=Scleroderma citrinum Foug A TaxID=1036808 RepID=A0A0C3EG49_9AGAM|nr:hypothetical protein SCLCIDRAFT_179649 [Scleroderma citrinum Foug A]
MISRRSTKKKIFCCGWVPLSNLGRVKDQHVVRIVKSSTHHVSPGSAEFQLTYRPTAFPRFIMFPNIGAPDVKAISRARRNVVLSSRLSN